MARVSLTVGKDRGPYDNKTPAALCPFNTNGKLPCFRGAGSFWKATLCWQTKQMQGRDTKSVFCRAHYHWVELLLTKENNGGRRCSDQKVWNGCMEAWSFDVWKLSLCIWFDSLFTFEVFTKTYIVTKMIHNFLHRNMLIQRRGVYDLT